MDVVPGPALPVWSGPSDIAVVATRTGAGRYAVTPAYEAARRGVSLVGIGAEDSPLRAACSGARAPYVPLPESRVRHTTLWSLLTPMLQLATDLELLPAGVADLDAVAAALDEIATECGPAQESFVNPAKTLALELLDALPVIAAEGPLADAAATRIADQLATLAGLPVTGFRLPDQRVAACAVLGGPLAPRADDDFFRDRADDAGRRLRLLTIRDPDAGALDGAGEREPRSAAEADGAGAAHRGGPRHPGQRPGRARRPRPVRPPPAAGPAAGRRGLHRRLPGPRTGQRAGARAHDRASTRRCPGGVRAGRRAAARGTAPDGPP